MKYLTLFLASLLLISCASLRPKQEHYQIMSAARRQTNLLKINQWRLNAVVGIRTPQKNVTGNLLWRQKNKNFSALLSGPLGFGSTRVAGKPGQFILWKSSQKRYIASSAEQLMKVQLGWSLPIANMYYWIRTLPIPHIPAKTRFDQYGHLIYLFQQGWKIYYTHFRSIQGIDLPTLIKLSNTTSQIKIVITHWSIKQTSKS